jgi:hypothetical protein
MERSVPTCDLAPLRRPSKRSAELRPRRRIIESQSIMPRESDAKAGRPVTAIDPIETGCAPNKIRWLLGRPLSRAMTCKIKQLLPDISKQRRFSSGAPSHHDHTRVQALSQRQTLHATPCIACADKRSGFAAGRRPVGPWIDPTGSSGDVRGTSETSTFQKMAECSQWLNTVTDNFCDGQHRHSDDRAGGTPHPEPEN